MFVDGRRLNGATLTADLCVIGAGAAGISLALQFIHRPLSVILLESGGLHFDERTQTLDDGENKSFIDFPLAATRLRYFGGTTNHWGGFTYPFSKFDFTPRPYIPVSGWPIPLAEVAAYYPGAGELCQLGPMDYSDVEGLQQRAGFPVLRLPREPMVPAAALFSPPTRFGKVYREPLQQASRTKVILHSNVQELVADDSVSRVEKVKVKCIGGAQYEVAARVFVIAMGGLESARVLLLSRGQRATGLGNDHDLVGRYYMDHLGFTGGRLVFSRMAPSFDFFMGYHEVGDNRVYGIFTPRPEVLLKENIGNFRVQLAPFDSIPGVEALKALIARPLARETLADLGGEIGNILVDLDEVTNTVYKTAFNRAGGFLGGEAARGARAAGAVMSVSAEQVPNPESRATLSEETDLFGQQRLLLRWRIEEADRRTLGRSMRLLAMAISAAGYARVRVPRELGTPAGDSLIEISCHQMGTTRMSNSPKTGVVDSDCRVHGISNLFIASSGVFPTSSWVNPTLTIIALTLRLAHRLKAQFG